MDHLLSKEYINTKSVWIMFLLVQGQWEMNSR